MTGYDADQFRVRLEGGSYGYLRGQVSFGGVAGRFDYVGSVMGRSRDGFREHSAENTERLFGNVGYKFGDQVENRFYVTLDRVDRQLPGGLTKQELKDDPRQPNADAVTEDFNKKWDLIRLADKFSFRNDGREFDAGLFWFHRNMEERGFFTADFREGITAFYSDNYGASLNFVTRDELFGRRNIFTVGSSPQLEREVAQNFENLRGHRGQTTALNTGISINVPLYAENQHYLTEQFSVLLGMQAIYAQRHFEDHFLSDDQGNQSHQQDFYGWNPKTGMIYEFDAGNQVFLNFSGAGNRLHLITWLNLRKAQIPALSIPRCNRNGRGRWSLAREGSADVSSGNCPFIAPGCGTSCSTSTTPREMTLEPSTSIAPIIRESKRVSTSNCCTLFLFQWKRTSPETG